MDDINPGSIIILVVLIVLSAVFSGTETAFSSLNRIRLKQFAESGDKQARRVLKIADDYDRMLSAVLICNNIVNISASSIGTVLGTTLFGPSAGPGISTLVITVVVLVFGEVMPKSYAKQNAERVALRVAGILQFVMKILTPVIFLFSKLNELVAHLTGTDEKQPTVTEQELKYIIEEIQDEGVLEQQESELVQSALDFDDILVEEILTPRVDVVSTEVHTDIESVKDLFLQERYSRIPVYEKQIDNIIGVVGERDFFMKYVSSPDFSLRDIMQKTFFVPPKMKIADLLRQLQHKKAHMAVVADQYGGVLGIITMEDILEELVGDIWDEDDEIIADIVPIGNNTYEVKGDCSIEDLFEELNCSYKDFKAESNTVSGWALEVFGKIPEIGESFIYENLTVTVHELEEQRILSLIVSKKDEPDVSDQE